MATVLTEGVGALTCPHIFPIPTKGAMKLTVGGASGVLTHAAVVATTPACTVADVTGPPVVNHCKKVLAITAAIKLTVASDHVVLDSETGTTDGLPGPPTITASALQLKLTAV
jgi:hypothetical protein